jgi:2-iminobutanoate/2-iminopropanoate deaminase
VGDIAKTTIYLTDMAKFPDVNLVYGSFFGSGPFPARETVGVCALPKNALVEISAIAAKK